MRRFEVAILLVLWMSPAGAQPIDSQSCSTLWEEITSDHANKLRDEYVKRLNSAYEELRRVEDDVSQIKVINQNSVGTYINRREAARAKVKAVQTNEPKLSPQVISLREKYFTRCVSPPPSPVPALTLPEIRIENIGNRDIALGLIGRDSTTSFTCP